MTIFITAGLVGFLLVGASRWWWLDRPQRSAELLDKAARDLDLAVDPRHAVLVGSRLVRREKAALAGHVGVSLVVLPLYGLYWLRAWPSTGDSKPPSFFPLMIAVPYASAMLGRQVALAWLLVHDAHRRNDQPGPRVARAKMPRLTDYVRPFEVWAARCIAVLMTPLAMLGAVVARSGTKTAGFLIPSLVVGVVLLAALWAMVELTARRLLDVGQPADSAVELAWDDALRSRQLRELFLFVSGFGLFLTMFSSVGLLPDSLSMLPFLGTVGALALLGFFGKPASHFRRRLWPWPSDGAAA